MQEHGTHVDRVINGGGIPRKSEILNQVYSNVLNKPILVPKGDVTGLGSAIFAFLAARVFPSIEKAQEALCPEYSTFEPQTSTRAAYEELYDHYRRLYFALGTKDSGPVALGSVLPLLRRLAATSRLEKAGKRLGELTLETPS